MYSEPKSPAQRCSGFTLLEVVIAGSILTMLAAALVESAKGMSRVTTTANVRGTMQEQAEKALFAIIPEIRRSGFVTVNELEFPMIIEDGVAPEDMGEFSHEPADSFAEEGDPDFGPSHEIIFVLPQDADNDGRPDLDEDSGKLVWGANVYTYTVETMMDGRNHLVRRINGETPESLGRGFERVVFDTPESSGWEEDFPLDSVRIRLYLRKQDETGAWFRHMSEVALRLRNQD